MEEKHKVQLCTEEIDEILKKYNCEMIVVPQKHYGQTVYVPVIIESKGLQENHKATVVDERGY